MRRPEESLLVACAVVLVLGLVVSGLVTFVAWRARKIFSPNDPVEPPAPGGWILGLMESFFYFAVLSTGGGAAFLAGAWLAFKLASRWQSANWAKPTPAETKIGIRAFQVGTLGTLLVGVIGAAIARY